MVFLIVPVLAEASEGGKALVAGGVGAAVHLGGSRAVCQHVVLTAAV